jgi:hypothetical protein
LLVRILVLGEGASSSLPLPHVKKALYVLGTVISLIGTGFVIGVGLAPPASASAHGDIENDQSLVLQTVKNGICLPFFLEALDARA